MQELLVDFIISLDGYASAEGWPGWWGLEGPEYLGWLGELEQGPEGGYPMIMGRRTYEVFQGFTDTQDDLPSEEEESIDHLMRTPKVVFSSTLEGPLPWPNTELVSGDAVEAVRAMKREGTTGLRTVGSVSLCRSLLAAGLVDRFRVVMFPVITGRTGAERIYDGYPDVALEMIGSRTFDGRTQLVEYRPTLLDGPPPAPSV